MVTRAQIYEAARNIDGEEHERRAEAMSSRDLAPRIWRTQALAAQYN